MSAFCYLNGEILPVHEAAIGISDLALQRGYGVFDFVRTYQRKLFHFEEHLQRLRNSASELHLKLPLSDEKITSIAEQLIEDSDLPDPAIRLLLTGGYAESPFLKQPNFMIITEAVPTFPPSICSAGVSLVLVEYQRELPHVKTINYMNALRLEPFRQEKDVFDLLYHSDQGITECPRSNFFAFQGDTLVTPATGVLYGVTRELILELASDHFPIQTRKIELGELSTIGEAFITATSKCVVPVRSIDGQDIGTGSVGERTRKMMKLYEEYTLNY